MYNNLNEIIDDALDYVKEQLVDGDKNKVYLEYTSMREDDADLLCRHFTLEYDVLLQYELEKKYLNNEVKIKTKITISKI